MYVYVHIMCSPSSQCITSYAMTLDILRYAAIGESGNVHIMSTPSSQCITSYAMTLDILRYAAIGESGNVYIYMTYLVVASHLSLQKQPMYTELE